MVMRRLKSASIRAARQAPSSGHALGKSIKRKALACRVGLHILDPLLL
jgi:hypothetical protein